MDISILAENKIVAVLEYYLSLHEADAVFNAIWNENFSCKDVEKMLDSYRKGE